MSTATNPPQAFARPTFPTLQPSNNSSTFQSYSSTTSLDSQASSSAPLPSPSSTHPPRQGFFGSLNQQQQPQQTQQQRPDAQRMSSFDYQPNREGAGRTAAETANFLNHSALLAEAAKRAQMAVVMRDIEGMEL